MSTLSSDLNSLGAVLLDDYHAKLIPGSSDRKQLRFSRLSVLVSGLLAVFLAMAMTRIHSMADAAFDFVALMGGGVLGIYLLGILTKRTSRAGLYTGIGIGILFILWAHFSNSGGPWPDSLPRFPLHTLWIGVLGNIIVFIAGFAASMLITPEYRADSSLTLHGDINTGIGVRDEERTK